MQLNARQTHELPERTRQLEEQNQELTKSLEQLQNGDRVVYNAHSTSAASCWLVEMSGERSFVAAEIGKAQLPRQFSSVSEVRSWMVQQHQSGAVFLLIVKPDAAGILDELSDHLRSQNVTFGFDLLPQNKAAIDPNSGAAAL